MQFHICSQCGEQNRPGARFCTQCGSEESERQLISIERPPRLNTIDAPDSFKWTPLPVENPRPIMRRDRRNPEDLKGRKIKLIGPIFNDPADG